MSVHCFEVFEFKSRFEFNCLGFFKKLEKKTFPFNPFTSYPVLARVGLGPSLAKSVVAPVFPQPSAPQPRLRTSPTSSSARSPLSPAPRPSNASGPVNPPARRRSLPLTRGAR
jgi:hypothetical protein